MNDLVVQYTHPDWHPILLNNHMPDLSAFELTKVTPAPKDWFRWACMSPKEIRVLMVGQEPYSEPGVANGLAFSCNGELQPPLRGIFQCLIENQLAEPEILESGGDLMHWAEQGVLLLNLALTTETGVQSAHKDIWFPYTRRVIELLSEMNSMVCMLWGNSARSLRPLLKGKVVIDGSIPSAFRDCNAHLRLMNMPAIRWHHASAQTSTTQPLIRIFTDGSCWPNKKSPAAQGGYAVVLDFSQYSQKPEQAIFGKLNTQQFYASNIRAEGFAIYRALKYLYQLQFRDAGYRKAKVVIYSDSKFWISMIQDYMPKWSEQDFLAKANPDLSQRVWKYWCSLRSKMNIDIVHVYAHNKDGGRESTDPEARYRHEYNDKADRLATYARLQDNHYRCCAMTDVQL